MKSLPILVTTPPTQRLQNMFQTREGIYFRLNDFKIYNFFVDSFSAVGAIWNRKFLSTIVLGFLKTSLL
jgi:hypothetical protein